MIVQRGRMLELTGGQDPLAPKAAPTDPNSVSLDEIAQVQPLAVQRRHQPPAAAAVITKQASKPEDEPVSLELTVRSLKRRLRVIEKQIKERKALEQERDAIKRLIKAAQEPKDNVRQLRSAQ